jgi:hypothetical protein
LRDSPLKKPLPTTDPNSLKRGSLRASPLKNPLPTIHPKKGSLRGKPLKYLLPTNNPDSLKRGSLRGKPLKNPLPTTGYEQQTNLFRQPLGDTKRKSFDCEVPPDW